MNLIQFVLQAGDYHDQLEDERYSHSQAMTSAQNDIARLRSDFSQSQIQLQETTRDKDSLDHDFERLREKADLIADHLDAVSAELAGYKEQATTRRRELEASQMELERVTRSKNEAEADNDRLTAALEELRASLATLDGSQSSQSDRAAALAVSLEQTSAAASSATESAERMKLDLDTLRSELNDALRARGELEGAVERMKAEANEREIKLGAVSSELESLRGDREEAVKTARSELEHARRTASELEERARLLEASLAESQAKASELEVTHSSLERMLKEKEQALTEFEASIAQEVEKANQLVRERGVALNAAVRQASKSQRELKSIMAAGDERTSELGKLRSTLAALEQEMARLRTTSEVTSSEVASLTQELERSATELEQSRISLEQREREKEDASRELAQLKELYAGMRADLEARDGELSALRSLAEAGDNGENGYDREYGERLRQTDSSLKTDSSPSQSMLFSNSTPSIYQQRVHRYVHSRNGFSLKRMPDTKC